MPLDHLPVYREKWVKTGCIPEHRFGELRCVGLSLSGDYIAFGGVEGLMIATTETGKTFAQLLQRTLAPVTALQWIHYNTVVCAFEDGTLSNFSMVEKRLMGETMTVKGHRMSHIAVDKYGRKLATGAGVDIRVWKRSRRSDVHSLGPWTLLRRIGEPPTTAGNRDAAVVTTSMHWRDPDQGHLIVAYERHGIHIWDVATGANIFTVSNTNQTLGMTSLSFTGSLIGVSTAYGVDIYDTVTGTPVRSFVSKDRHWSGPICCINDELSTLAVPWDVAGQIRLWSIRSGGTVGTLQHEGAILDMAVYTSPWDTASRIAAVTRDSVILWESTCQEDSRKHPRSAVLGWYAQWAAFVLFALALATYSIGLSHTAYPYFYARRGLVIKVYERRGIEGSS